MNIGDQCLFSLDPLPVQLCNDSLKENWALIICGTDKFLSSQSMGKEKCIPANFF